MLTPRLLPRLVEPALDLQVEAERFVDCMNLIVEERVARRGRIRRLYKKLPEGAREAIEQRDAGSKS